MVENSISEVFDDATDIFAVVKLVPLNVNWLAAETTFWQAESCVGEFAKVNDGGKVNELELVPVPPGEVTLIVPSVPGPAIAVICVSESTVKDWTAVPPIVKVVALVK